MKSTNKLNISTKPRLSLKAKIGMAIGGSSVLAAGILLLTATNPSTSTILPGNWSTASVWSSNIPENSGQATINHPLTIDKDLVISSGTYTINSPITDATGGTAFSLSLSGSSSVGLLEVNANATFEGPCNVNSKGKIVVKSGDTLRVGTTVFNNGSFVTIEEGGVLIVNGDLENKNNSTGIQIDGKLIVKGNLSGGNGSVIFGNGNLETTGAMSGSGTVFGSSPLNCSGPCDGRSLAGFTNTIYSSQSICIGQAAATLTGTTNASNATYQWQKSSDNVTFSNISGITSANYYPGAVATSTWYRRIVSSGGKSSNSASVKITVNTSGIWTGSVNNQWNNTGNWCGGAIPQATQNVTISSNAVTMPLIPSGSFTCNNLTIMSGATLELSSGATLNVKGNIINQGTIKDNGGTIVMNGVLPQTISGNTTTMGALTINNLLGVSVESKVKVTGILKLLKGILLSNNNLTINLDAGGIAYASSDLGSIFGKITVERTIHSSKYHYLSSPLISQSVSDLTDDVAIGKGNVYYYYDETNTSKNNAIGWTGITNASVALNTMQGYAVYFTSSRTVDNTGSYIHGSSPYSINLTRTHTGFNGADGWNLVGNPYPSSIDWDGTGWTKTNVYNSIYCWDSQNNRYTYYSNGGSLNGGSRYIAPYQAFWVRVDTTKQSGTLKATSLVRSTKVARFYKVNNTPPPTIKLAVAYNGMEDETMIRFMDEASNEFDSEYDAFKLLNEGNNPSLLSMTDNLSYAINTLGMLVNDIEIPLKIIAKKAGSYKLTARELQNFDATYTIVLEDNINNTSQELTEGTEVIFTMKDLETTSRYTLKITRKVLNATNGTSSSPTDAAIYWRDKNLYIHSDGSAFDASLLISGMNGSLVKNEASLPFQSGEIVYDLSGMNPGMYIVSVTMNQKMYSKKVLLY